MLGRCIIEPLFAFDTHMKLSRLINRGYSWRWLLAILVSGFGLAGFLSGVGVSERDISDASIGTHLYHTLGLFILGGIDLGTPVGGPVWGRTMLWIGYFGAPLVTGSAIAEWVQQIFDRPDVYLRRARDHILVIGVSQITHSLLTKVRAAAPSAPLMIVDKSVSPAIVAEFAEKYHARILTGDFTSEFFLRSLRIQYASQIIIASDDDFDNFEAASKVLSLRPHIGHRLLVHSNRLRFLRMLNYSRVVNNALTFNTYHLSAQHMVREVMLKHFESTESADTVVIAGFGRFGQTIYEEIQRLGSTVVSDVAIIDDDANRRILVAEEQVKLRDGIRRHVFQGDLSHPRIWLDLEKEINLQGQRSLILLATRADDENLRTGLWIKRKYPDAKVMVRTTQPSHFARDVCDAAGIDDFALSEMMVHSMPDEWFAHSR